MAKPEPKARVSVAGYLRQQIDFSGKTQAEIAQEVGGYGVNFISLIKHGKSKLPINKVPLFAKALGLDSAHLFRMVMQEYNPETWAVIEEIMGAGALSASEQAILDIVRKVAVGYDIAPRSEAEIKEFAALVLKWRQREEKLLGAAHERVVKSGSRAGSVPLTSPPLKPTSTFFSAIKNRPVDPKAPSGAFLLGISYRRNH